jgi:hypothetical protein
MIAMPDPYTRPGEKRFTLRIDADLFDRVAKYAKANRRSVAKEVENAIAMYVDYHDEAQANYLRDYPDSQHNR